MPTQFFLFDAEALDQTPPGNLSTDVDLRLGLATRDAAADLSVPTDTVAGPTAGIQVGSSAAQPRSWYSPTLTGVTITGTVTLNVWMREFAMADNVGAQVMVDRCSSTGAFISTIVNSEKGTELTTTMAAQNWTATPTSTTLATGDRIRVRVYGNDVGTMGAGGVFYLQAGAATAGATGDSYVTFTETITEGAAPAGRVPYVSPYPQLLAQ